MDVRLYKKAKSVAEPFEFDKYRKKKIRETIEQDRANRVQVKQLPKVNKDLALKLMNDQLNKKKKDTASSLLSDDRFKDLFANPDFEVDKNTDEYRLLNPVLSRLDNAKKKELKKKLLAQEFEPVEVRNFLKVGMLSFVVTESKNFKSTTKIVVVCSFYTSCVICQLSNERIQTLNSEP